MRIAGIIAECNPFHEGHRYLLRKARETGADYVVVLMSGDFVQRGAPAILPKEIRARDILLGGADAVLELPVLYATSSAEVFADGAVATLCALNGITDLFFGSESGDLKRIEAGADFLLKEESKEFKASLQSFLAKGETFPSARAKAARKTAGVDLAETPNDLLATQYLYSLSKLRTGTAGITPHAVLRTTTAGAKEIRERMLKAGEKGLAADDFSDMLYYRLRMLTGLQKEKLKDFLDVSDSLAERITNHLAEFDGFDGFTSLIKTRDITYTRAQRALLHILLDIKKEDLESFRTPGYVRVLGVRKEKENILGILGEGKLLLLGALGRDSKKVPDRYLRMMQMDIFASELYDGIFDPEGDHCEYHKRVLKI